MKMLTGVNTGLGFWLLRAASQGSGRVKDPRPLRTQDVPPAQPPFTENPSSDTPRCGRCGPADAQVKCPQVEGCRIQEVVQKQAGQWWQSWGTRKTPGSSRKACPGTDQRTRLQGNCTKTGFVRGRLPTQRPCPDLPSSMCVPCTVRMQTWDLSLVPCREVVDGWAQAHLNLPSSLLQSPPWGLHPGDCHPSFSHHLKHPKAPPPADLQPSCHLCCLEPPSAGGATGNLQLSPCLCPRHLQPRPTPSALSPERVVGHCVFTCL